MPEAVPSPAGQRDSQEPGRSLELTPELVKKIAARVYAMMLADIKIERERRRIISVRLRNSNGGRHAV
jgi:hypothetical protein